MPAIRVHVKGFDFTPRWFPTLAALVIFAILVSLGCWQLSRMQEKQQLQLAFHQRRLTDITLADIKPPLTQLRFLPIKLTGTFDNQHSFLLDNKIYHRQAGFEVITPFKSGKQIILVNRGWLPAGKNRRQPPNITPVSGSQTIHGMLYLPSRKGITLGKEEPNEHGWPKIVQTTNIKLMHQLLQQPLMPMIVLLDAHNPYGFERHWRATTMKPEKHLGYAIQWFALALTLLIIYITVNTKRRKHDNP